MCLSIVHAIDHGQGPNDAVRAFCLLNCLEKLRSASRQAAEPGDARACRELLSLLQAECPRPLFLRIAAAVAQARQP